MRNVVFYKKVVGGFGIGICETGRHRLQATVGYVHAVATVVRTFRGGAEQASVRGLIRESNCRLLDTC